MEEENPWAGSLRHVDDHRKGKAKKEEKEDTYGNAPWMGTLRFACPGKFSASNDYYCIVYMRNVHAYKSSFMMATTFKLF